MPCILFWRLQPMPSHMWFIPICVFFFAELLSPFWDIKPLIARSPSRPFLCPPPMSHMSMAEVESPWIRLKSFWCFLFLVVCVLAIAIIIIGWLCDAFELVSLCWHLLLRNSVLPSSLPPNALQWRYLMWLSSCEIAINEFLNGMLCHYIYPLDVHI
jgi:hypothetical protein